MSTAVELGESMGKAAACRALNVPRSSLYRVLNPPEPREPGPRPTPARSLSPSERAEVLNALHAERFADQAPREIYATLLDEETYLCSIRTMYRVLQDAEEVRERRNQLRHPRYRKPELMATGPNQVWSWDITKLRGPMKGLFYHLYVILDIFSRYVVGWMVAHLESADLASRLIRTSCQTQGIEQGSLVIHSDGGPSMKSKPVVYLLASLGVTKSRSRPHVSNDNPYSESQFKTLKYCPAFPGRFGSYEHARSFCQEFFRWYQTEHHHTGIALLTPEIVHTGRAATVLEARRRVLLKAYEAHPERFVRKPPSPQQLPPAVWINPPAAQPAAETEDTNFDPEDVP
jgi:putative transposase